MDWTLGIGAVVAVLLLICVRAASRTGAVASGGGGPRRVARDCVHVNLDGSARELSPAEMDYVYAEHLPGDCGAPALKSSYDSRDGWGSMAGLLERDRLPEGVEVQPVHPGFDARVAAYERDLDPARFIAGGADAHFEQLRRYEEFARCVD